MAAFELEKLISNRLLEFAIKFEKIRVSIYCFILVYNYLTWRHG